MVLVLNPTTRRLGALLFGAFWYALCFGLGLYVQWNNRNFWSDANTLQILLTVPTIGVGLLGAIACVMGLICGLPALWFWDHTSDLVPIALKNK